jgi:hypothetical protein
VQIYAGAPNIREYEPGAHSIVAVADFKSPQDMADYVQAFLDDEARYNEMFAWKQAGLSPQFEAQLANCVHLAECRMCELLHERRKAKVRRGKSALGWFNRCLICWLLA